MALPHAQLAGSLTRVVVPQLAKAHRAGNSAPQVRRVRAIYGYSVGTILAVIGGVAPAVVGLVLGPQWGELTGTVVAIIALGAIVQSVSWVFNWALVSAGKTRTFLKSEVPAYLAVILGVILVAPRGAIAVAFVYTAGQYLRAFLIVIWGPPALGIGRWEYLRPALGNLLVLAIIFTGGLALIRVWPNANNVLTVAGGLAWALLVITMASLSSKAVRLDVGHSIAQVSRVIGLKPIARLAERHLIGSAN